ncbi:MAG: TIGR02452 family protein [Candidatus Algichlamydia australiensis]|nr:TIGR02452 family protein [Chlamydiales bacterium]
MRLRNYFPPTWRTCGTCTIGGTSLLWALERALSNNRKGALYCLIPGTISLLNLRVKSTYLNVLSLTLVAAKLIFDPNSPLDSISQKTHLPLSKEPDTTSGLQVQPADPIQEEPDVIFEQKKPRSEAGKQALALTRDETYPSGADHFRATEVIYQGVVGCPDGTKLKDITVSENDCLSQAQEEASKEGSRVLLVMFGSPEEPGGGFLHENGGQEEDICRRSTMAGWTDHVKGMLEEAVNRDSDLFTKQDNPEKGSFCLYNHHFLVPNVTVFQDSEEKNFKRLDKPFQIDILYSTAVNRSHIAANEPATKEELNEMLTKIWDHLKIAEEREYTTLITGAFGCGEFNNSPKTVAGCYSSGFETLRFNSLKKVIFSITPDSKGSLEAFQEKFIT